MTENHIKKTSLPSGFWRTPNHFLAIGFGAGYVRLCPGTIGTLVAVPMVWLMQALPWYSYILVTLVVVILGVEICGRAAKELGVHDHSGIVWDEIAGYMVTMWLIPEGLVWLVLGFVIFRFFDIVKPWPINWLDDNVSGGWGIMLDDILAGIYSLICMHIVVLVW